MWVVPRRSCDPNLEAIRICEHETINEDVALEIVDVDRERTGLAIAKPEFTVIFVRWEVWWRLLDIRSRRPMKALVDTSDQ